MSHLITMMNGLVASLEREATARRRRAERRGGAKPVPLYSDAADKIIRTICDDRPLTDAEFLDLAMACLDQAGVTVDVQDKVRELLS